MLDPKFIRNNLEAVAKLLSKRGFTLDVKEINQLESERKDIETLTQELQNQRNVKSKNIGIAKSKGEDASVILAEVAQIADQLNASEAKLKFLQEKIHSLYLNIPNIPHETVPEGKSELENQVIREWGKKPEFNFEVKDHAEIGAFLNGMDFELASKISGTRFVVLFNGIARLHRALIQFMLDIHTEQHGYTETYVPYLVKHESLYGTGQLPKFWEDQFNIEGDMNLSLIPTAEVPVTNLVRDTILDIKDLPLKYVAHTPCFRSEAGSYGKDTKGMIRQHQFEKVELVQIVHPEHSYEAHEALTQHAETILQKLNLAYRVVALCTGDLGFGSAKTYDLEVWLPSQNTYREISSCSNFEDFQARRMSARFKDPETKKNHLVHTINGSGLAVGRTLVAILENYQQADGSIIIPEILRPYFGGSAVLSV